MKEEMGYFVIFAAVLFIGALVGVFAVVVVEGVNAPSWEYATGSIVGVLLSFFAWQRLEKL
jgi:hypothetical protein